MHDRESSNSRLYAVLGQLRQGVAVSYRAAQHTYTLYRALDFTVYTNRSSRNPVMLDQELLPAVNQPIPA
ncbi:hypothetical protein CIB48_g11575 [Xylaria polymorpha]|nr:hypothetical protein CIB48_g11575 [Xylaria polymorpha]